MNRAIWLLVLGLRFLVPLASVCFVNVGMAAPPASAPATRPSNGLGIVVDPELPNYERVNTLEGKIRSIGSSPVSSLLATWGDEFKRIYPQVEIEINAGGSSLAPKALIEPDPPQLAAMDRPMTSEELAAFKKKFGYAPVGVPVAYNALTIYVNADNPCRGLSLAQLDGIVSRTFRSGHGPIATWGQAGVTDPQWINEPIIVHIPRKGRAAHDLIKSRILLGGEFRFEAHTEMTASAIMQEVAVDRGGIGVASIIFRTRRTHPVAIQAEDGIYYEPTYENTATGRYPLSTYFYVYINKPPNKPLDRLTREFLVFACSQAAQEFAAAEGAFPLTSQLATEALKLIGP